MVYHHFLYSNGHKVRGLYDVIGNTPFSDTQKKTYCWLYPILSHYIPSQSPICRWSSQQISHQIPPGRGSKRDGRQRLSHFSPALNGAPRRTGPGWAIHWVELWWSCRIKPHYFCVDPWVPFFCQPSISESGACFPRARPWRDQCTKLSTASAAQLQQI